ncbi:hypothetical protein F383_21030 [Gossypium arboreum]|uniref:Uncharacterized protein n=1 Tax=Gossypium arboreum TaxID=29729 RepID=A0A0B0NTB7_GOSAR|nr:hypothetical protein F383_21030 [Gossypium arboreum]
MLIKYLLVMYIRIAMRKWLVYFEYNIMVILYVWSYDMVIK